MEYNLTLKEKFVQWWCPLVDVSNGVIFFPFVDIAFDIKYKYIKDDPHYRTLKKKMKNLLKMVNKDHNVGYMDIETDLWYKI